MSEPRPHAEMIKRWADDKGGKVYCRPDNNCRWSLITTPYWARDVQYLFVPSGYDEVGQAFMDDELEYRLSNGEWLRWEEFFDHTPEFSAPIESYRQKPRDPQWKIDLVEALRGVVQPGWVAKSRNPWGWRYYRTEPKPPSKAMGKWRISCTGDISPVSLSPLVALQQLPDDIKPEDSLVRILE